MRLVADPLSLHSDERGLLLLAAVGLLLFLALLALHSPTRSPQSEATRSGRAVLDEAWLSQWLERGAEQAGSEEERAALQQQLTKALANSWPPDRSSQTAPVPSLSPLSLPLAASSSLAADSSDPLPAALLSESAAISASGFRGAVGVLGTACSRVTDRAECGERRQCSGHGRCAVQAEYCQGFNRYREWACECECGRAGVWCQQEGGDCDSAQPQDAPGA